MDGKCHNREVCVCVRVSLIGIDRANQLTNEKQCVCVEGSGVFAQVAVSQDM